MTYALIDNSTLTAVQRITGQVESRSRYSVDGDIAALENVIQAILFYDDVISIDDYKEKYKEERKKQFDFIKFLDPNQFNLDEIKNIATKETRNIVPTIRGGEFADEDFKEFLELLKMHIVCTWDISSSIYYLNMKMLGQPDTAEFDKYSDLSASIFAELADAAETKGEYNSKALLVDRNGHNISFPGYKVPGAKWGNGEAGGTTDALDAFVASLSWLSYKSIYYLHSARYLQADTFLYPIRQAFQVHYMNKTSAYGYDFTSSLLSNFNKSLSGDITRIISSDRATATSFDIPIFSAWLVKETGNVKNVIEAALQLKKDHRIVEARENLKAIRNLFDSEDLAAANKKVGKLHDEVTKASNRLLDDFGLKTQSAEYHLLDYFKFTIQLLHSKVGRNYQNTISKCNYLSFYRILRIIQVFLFYTGILVKTFLKYGLLGKQGIYLGLK